MSFGMEDFKEGKRHPRKRTASQEMVDKPSRSKRQLHRNVDSHQVFLSQHNRSIGLRGPFAVLLFP